MKSRVLITGAQGFIGRYLIAHWLAADPEVEIVGIGRSPRRLDTFTHTVRWGKRRFWAPLPLELAQALRDERYRYVAIDLRELQAVTGLLQGFRPEAVVHLAGEPHDAPPTLLLWSNVGATITLLDAIVGAGITPPRVVLGSTGGVYGRVAPEALPLTEDTPTAPADLYAVSKRAAEDAARILCERRGIPLSTARIFSVLGPGQSESHFEGWIAAQAAAIASGELAPHLEVDALEATGDFLDVRDVAAALRLLAERGADFATYNLGSGVETKLAEIFSTTLELAQIASVVHVAHRAGREGEACRRVAAVGRLRALGFEPRHALRATLGDTLAYYRGLARGAPLAGASAR